MTLKRDKKTGEEKNSSLKTDLSTLNTNFSRFCSVRMASKDLTTTFSLCSHESLINRDSNFFTISTNGIKILKTGYYEISASVMVRTGFSVDDLVVVQIGSSANDPVIKSQIRVQNASAWENIVIPPRIMHISANTTLGMYARNETASRDSIFGNNPIDDRITIALKQLI